MRGLFWQRSRQHHGAQAKGYTLLELLVVLVIIGIFAAILIPSWNFLLNMSRLNIAQDQLLQAMQVAKSNAKRSRTVQQFSIRTVDGTVQWAISPAGRFPAESLWQSLDAAIQLDSETTLLKVGTIRRVQFTHEGRISGQLGRVTLSPKNVSRLKRCVVVSTLLGKIRTGTDKPTKRDGFRCW
jgi:prepilin-type N-terminal cleavage/methylation domain-containing protein